MASVMALCDVGAPPSRVDMQRFRWPGFAMRLVGELQNQQNNSQFCDTLLQTEGISIPTHSFILKALSPYLSQRLASSPSPSADQKVRLPLQDVKAQTLLKLVGLLYSGEVEVNRGDEQDDVLALARRFGITGLLEGHRDDGTLTVECSERRPESVRNCCHTEERRMSDDCKKMMDAQVQSEMTDGMNITAQVENRSFSSTGTQTVEREMTDNGTQATDASLVPGASEFHNQNMTQEKRFSHISRPEIHNVCSDASPGDRPSSMLQSPALTSRNMLTLCLSHDNQPNYATIQEDGTYHQLSEFSDDTLSELENQQRNNRGDRELPCQLDSSVTPGEERASSTDRRRYHIGMKSLNKMKDMQETTETAQISVKVKLRRRTEKEVWEVVSLLGTDKTVSDFAFLKQNDSNCRTVNADVENILPSPWMAQHDPVLDPDPCFSLTSFANSSASPPQSSSDSQAPSSGCFTPNNNSGPEAPSLLNGPFPLEESDEQIEKMLDDIMMGLNILPNLERDSRMSHHIEARNDTGATTCQLPDSHKDVGHGQTHPAVSAAGCGFYQVWGTASHSSSDTGAPCDSPAQCPPTSSPLPSVLPDAALIQQQECSTLGYRSIRSQWQSDGVGHQCSTVSKTEGYPHPKAPRTRPARSTSVFSTQQKICDSSTQKRLLVINDESFPLSNGSKPHSCHSVPLPCMDDIRLPPCLSPLEPHISPAKFSLFPSNATTFANASQPAPLFQRPPWLSGSLPIPRRSIAHRQEFSAYLPKKNNHLLQQSQDHVVPDEGNRAGSQSVEKASSAECLKVAKRKLKHAMTDNEHDAAKEEVAPRRKRIKSCPQVAASSLFPLKGVKVSDATKSQLGLNICKVSLSSNNVLAKDRLLAANSCNIKFVRKPSQQSVVTEGQTQRSRRPKPQRTRIKTRGFERNTENSPKETSLEKRSESMAGTPDKQEVKKRKRGRPAKPKPPAVNKKRSHDDGGQQQREGASEDKLEKGNKTKEMFNKRGTNRGKVVEEVPVKKAKYVRSKTKPDTNANDRRSPEILKRLQKLFVSRHFKTRKSKKKQDSAKAVDRKQKAGNSSMNDSNKKGAMDKKATPNQDTKRCKEAQAVADNNNNNHIFDTSEDKKKPQQEETDSFHGPRLSCHSSSLEEGNTVKAVQRMSPNEGTTSGTGTSNSTQEPNKALSPGHLLQRDNLLSCDSTTQHTPEETCPSLSGACRISKSPECEEEEEEVDVLLCSPAWHPRESELPLMEMIPDEEEEEENDIDVTGD